MSEEKMEKTVFDIYVECFKARRLESISNRVFSRMYSHRPGKSRNREKREVRESNEYKNAVNDEIDKDEVLSLIERGLEAECSDITEGYAAIEPFLKKQDLISAANPLKALGAAEADRERYYYKRAGRVSKRINDVINKNRDAIVSVLMNDIDHYFAKKRQWMFVERNVHVSGRMGRYSGWTRRYVRKNNALEYLNALFPPNVNDEGSTGILEDQSYISGILMSKNLAVYVIKILEREDPDIKLISRYSNRGMQSLAEAAKRSSVTDELLFWIREYCTRTHVFGLLKDNDNLKKFIDSAISSYDEAELLRKTMLTRIPDEYPNLYPRARLMKRHFYLHIGPTNSGKTHDAVLNMARSDSGVYLAPLRLLAFEQYERLNDGGCPCSLITGEERRLAEYSFHQSCTIEMADMNTVFDTAVIDEAQMIEDQDRGGAWTAAILGILAKEVYVCAAEHAVDKLIELIESCNDTYEVIYHKRKTPLVMDTQEFSFPKSVREGDALIVFSRRDAHAVASELERKGIQCSLIYGALPHEVRHREANEFAEGRFRTVVATDAIGMGMNLPIKRIVFLKHKKFDGHNTRFLYDKEIQQIAGRAGRYGIEEVGLVNSDVDPGWIWQKIESRPFPVKKAMISFPQTLLTLEAPLSEILEKWSEMEAKSGFEIVPVEREIKLAKILEAESKNKTLIYDLVTLPFDERDEELLEIWTTISVQILNNEAPAIFEAIPPAEEIRLDMMEHNYQVCDLLFGLSDRAQDEDLGRAIMARKDEISDGIFHMLSNRNLEPKKCRRCGKLMAWNYPHRICGECHRGRNQDKRH